tara:strand:+ start:2944 stop:3327 length:384 start_codon:yes stop_codon:yes gene_type:complete
MTNSTEFHIHGVEAFSTLKPIQKKEYLSAVMEKAKYAFDEAYKVRASKTSGSAFLWVSLYGKDAISRAFRNFVKTSHECRIMNNYRGTKNAWYFGSQSSHGYWDGLNAMCKVLSAHGIESFTCDEWD